MLKKVVFSVIIIFALNIFALEYSNEPLSANVIMDKAELFVDLVYFNNYLADTTKSIAKEDIQGLTEHTYLLIDSIVKGKYAEDREFQEAELFGLLQLYNWGSELGLYGCDLAASYFDDDSALSIIESSRPDSSFILTFNYPNYSINSEKNNWSVDFPYYFMISKMYPFRANYGTEVQYIKLSTLYANHLQDDQYSQSTISLIVSPTEDAQTVINFWLKAFKITADSLNEDFELDFQNYYDFDKLISMHKEITFINRGDCVFVLGYLGLDGPYQSNRIHYLDLIKNLKYQ